MGLISMNNQAQPSDIERLVGLYQRLIGTNGGNRDLDAELWSWLYKGPKNTAAYAGHAGVPHYTSSMDAANQFLIMSLPGWQIHTLHGGVSLWHCNVCLTNDAEETAGGIGKSAAVAILSAAITGLISQRLLYWSLDANEHKHQPKKEPEGVG